jgi:hypothetical protein
MVFETGLNVVALFIGLSPPAQGVIQIVVEQLLL